MECVLQALLILRGQSTSHLGRQWTSSVGFDSQIKHFGYKKMTMSANYTQFMTQVLLRPLKHAEMHASLESKDCLTSAHQHSMQEYLDSHVTPLGMEMSAHCIMDVRSPSKRRTKCIQYTFGICLVVQTRYQHTCGHKQITTPVLLDTGHTTHTVE
jgi:hypothetical protein